MLQRFGLFLAMVGVLAATPASADKLTLLTEDLPPQNYVEDGELKGLGVDMVRELQRRLGHEGDIQVVPWARGYKAALKQPNVALFSTARSTERERLFKWVGPLMDISHTFYKRRGSPIELDSVDDARSVDRIATYRDDIREQYLKERGFTNLDSSPKQISGARKLLEGRVDLWFDSNLSAPQVVEQLGHDPAELEPVLAVHSNSLYIAISNETDDTVVARWQRTLEAMAQDGTFRRIHNRWLPQQPLPEPMAELSPQADAPQVPLTLLTEELPPLNFVRDGDVAGVSVDIVREILRRLDRTDPIRLVPWARGYRMAQENRNTALFTTTRTPRREERFHWVGPIGSNKTVLYAKRGSDIRIDSLDDARHIESIGTYKDDVDEQFLRENSFTNIYSHSKPVSIVRNLMAGRVQLWIIGEKNAAQLVRLAGYSMDALEPVYTLRNIEYYIAFSLGTPPAIVERWRKTLEAMRTDGTLDRIHENWADTAGVAAE